MDDPNVQAHPILRLVGPDERLHALAQADGYQILVTDRRIAIAQGIRIALNVPIERVRRIEFDIEMSRPATLVIVPEKATDAPQVLTVPVDQYEEVVAALVRLGRLMAERRPG